MANYRVHVSNGWNNRPADYKIKAMEKMAWYLLKKVNDGSKDVWEDTILAIAFKDFALSIRSLALAKSCSKLAYFTRQCNSFKKPFWIFNRLWAYYSANYLIQ